jgi:hypothetical protein
MAAGSARAQMAALAVAVALSLLAGCADALQFYLGAGHKRCFYDAVPPGTKVMGEYTVAAGRGLMNVDLDVLSEDGRVAYFLRKNIGHGKFAFIVPFDQRAAPHVKHAENPRKHMLQAAAENITKPYSAVLDHTGRSRWRLPADRNLRPGELSDEHIDAEDEHAGLRNDDNNWDMDDYGISDEDLDEESRIASDAYASDRNHDPDMYPRPMHDRFGDIVMSQRDVDEAFAEQRFVMCVADEKNSGGPAIAPADGSAGASTLGAQRRVRLVVNMGDAAHDLNRLARREHMTSLEASLVQISGELKELLRQLEHAQKMEDALRALNFATGQRVMTYASISTSVIFIVAVASSQYTSGYFKRKKLC